MTVYNGEKYIKTAIDSILSQTIDDWELIIVENSSTDSTREIIDSYKDDRIVAIKLNQTIERTKALNLSLKNSKAGFIAILDADDISESNRLAIEVDFLKKHLDAGLVCSHAKLIDQNELIYGYWKPPVYPKELNDNITWSMPICHSTTMIRRNIIESELNGYDENMKIGQDWDLGIRIACNYKIYCLDVVLGSWRRYSSSTTGNPDNFIFGRMETIKILRKASKIIKNNKVMNLNKWQISVNMLGLSILYLKNKKIIKSAKFFVKSIFISPRAIVKNNYVNKILFKNDCPLYVEKV